MALAEHEEEKIVVGMFDRGLLGFPEGGKQLKSGRVSPYYYNSRGFLSHNMALERSGGMSVKAQREFIRSLVGGLALKLGEIEHPVSHVSGKAQASTTSAGLAAFLAGMSYIWERVDESDKTYGYHQKIEGDYEPGDTVLMVDDVVTDGKSKVEGAGVLRAVELEPVAVTLQFDREEGGVQTLENDYDLEVNSVTTLSKAARFLLDNSRIGSSDIEALQAYHEELRASGITSTFKVA